MSTAHLGTDHHNQQQRLDNDVCEGNHLEASGAHHSIEIEESEYPLIFTDKKGLAMIAFVTIGLAFGFSNVYPYFKDEKSEQLLYLETN